MQILGCGFKPELWPVLALLWALNFVLTSRIECEEAEEENQADLPVQGPLPYEPEDAPWRKNESGIRKL